MHDLDELYQAVILEHNRRPRNFEQRTAADRTATGYNPMCGDQFTVFVDLDGERIKQVCFHGAGCAISKASGSVMTAALKGKTVAEADQLFEQFHHLVTTGQAGEEFSDLSAFAGVCHFPARIKCATLAWHAARSALHGEAAQVKTE
jgi:nitrogen fixation protein NifU and related proteins